MHSSKLNLAILSLATALNRSAAPLVVFSGGLVGLRLAPDPVWATLPVAIIVVGMGVFSYPAADIMRRIGRRAGCVLATLVASAAAVLAGFAIIHESFSGFCVSMLLLGGNQAFVQQYRFAAAENVSARWVGHAVSLVLLSSLASAYLGPELGTVGMAWVREAPFAGSFFGLAAVQLLAAALLAFYRDVTIEVRGAHVPERPLGQIIRQPTYIVAAGAAACSYAAMSLIMTAAPLSMHAGHGYSLDAAALAIQGHIVAMYLPSLVTGTLIARLGVHRIMLCGIIILAATVWVAVWQQTELHYYAALILLGIGWNFLYTAGSTLITSTYRSSERFKAQGVNDLIVFGIMASTSLAAGALLKYAGWNLLVLATVPMLLLMLGLLVFGMRRSDDAAVSARSAPAAGE